MAERDVGEVNVKDCWNELDEPSCIFELGNFGFILLMPSARIPRGECAPTEYTFAVIVFLMARPLSENCVCAYVEE